MILRYFLWQFGQGPLFILALAWNMQHALARYFSVYYMLRTLVSHWHRDAISYDHIGLSQIFVAVAWNMISRVIGLIVRTITLALWLVCSVILFVVSVAILLLFIAWPFLVIAGIVWSLMQI